MGLAKFGRKLKAGGRRVWVLSLTPNGMLGELVAIDLFGRPKTIARRELWQGDELPENLPLAKGEAAILLLPRSYLLVKELSFPQLTGEQLAQVVPLEIEAVLPDFGETYSAWHRAPREQGEGATVYAAAASRVDRILGLLVGRGIKLWGVAPQSWARAQALGAATTCEEEVLLLDFQEGIELVQSRKGTLVYSYQTEGDPLATLETFIKAKGEPERLVLNGDYPPKLVSQLRERGFAPEETKLELGAAVLEGYLAGNFPDLAPPQLRERRFLGELKTGNYFLVGIALLLLLSFFGWLAGYQSSLAEREREATAQLAKLKAKTRQNQTPQGLPSTDWLSAWAVVTTALPEGAWLSEMKLVQGGQLAIVGFAPQQSDVATVISRLNAQGIGPVILNYARQKKIGEETVAEFQLIAGKKEGGK